ncbi:MAG: prepilin peptidase, partial [Proteobacteria bacterium]|nr:prepilin peptidase [Pseudomonadota bacterium]
MAELNPTLLMVYAGLFGAVLGSFLNVVIHRLPRQLEAETQAWLREQTGQPRLETKPYNLAWPASHCPQCERPLPWFHNLPVLSWLALRGRSACCNTPIAKRYPLVEGLMALLTMGLVQRFGVGPEAGALIMLTG